jgi:hypothetical protein
MNRLPSPSCRVDRREKNSEIAENPPSPRLEGIPSGRPFRIVPIPGL